MGRRSQPLIWDRCVERGEIDRPYRLGTKHERIEPQAFPINLRFRGKTTQAIEAGFGFGFNAAVEQMDSCKIARVLQRGPQGESPPGTAVVILRGPVIAVPDAPAPDRRQRDRLIANERVGLQALAKCCEVAQRLDGGTRLARGLARTIELAQRIG